MKIKKIKKIKNMTPHDINIVGEDGKVIVTFPSEGLIRLSQTTEQVGSVECDGVKIPITKTKFGKAEGLPLQEEGTIYIVSSLTCQAYPDRLDFFIPDQLVRDKDGIVGCRSLSQNPFSFSGERGGEK